MMEKKIHSDEILMRWIAFLCSDLDFTLSFKSTDGQVYTENKLENSKISLYRYLYLLLFCYKYSFSNFPTFFFL